MDVRRLTHLVFLLFFFSSFLFFSFFFNDTATTEIYTLSLHDALPIFFVASVYASERETCGFLDTSGVLRSVHWMHLLGF